MEHADGYCKATCGVCVPCSATFANEGYELFESLSGVPQEWEGVNYTVDYTSMPWAWLAWGANIDDPDDENQQKRAQALSDVGEMLGSDAFSRIKAQVCFDSDDSGGEKRVSTQGEGELAKIR